jgi:hypothetical protein
MLDVLGRASDRDLAAPKLFEAERKGMRQACVAEAL